ncbi:hypothetical protein TNCV_4705321 [Trichonephila clavipes]|nr:hypothetical protein TNCV_4705321 [Trichonephila clavipes]
MSTARPFPKHLTWSPGVRFREAGWSGCAVPLEKKRGSRCNRGAIYWKKYLAERLFISTRAPLNIVGSFLLTSLRQPMVVRKTPPHLRLETSTEIRGVREEPPHPNREKDTLRLKHQEERLCLPPPS